MPLVSNLNLETIFSQMGKAGLRLSEMGAAEGAAGNLSVYLGWQVELPLRYQLVETIQLPLFVPELAGGTFLVTGSGTRLREISEQPAANVGSLVVAEGGETAGLYATPERVFQRVTSEFNSHLAVHYDQVLASGANFQALVHAQPPHLTYLSHIERYEDGSYRNRRLLRWQPETILQFPEGIGFAPFHPPGSGELMEATVQSLRQNSLVIWGKHGVMARSAISVQQAVDRIEYAEAAARYEWMDLAAGGQARGLTDEEIRSVCRAFGIQQTIF